MVQAWSQVGSRLAVASMANSRRPRVPARRAGRRSTSRRNASVLEEGTIGFIGLLPEMILLPGDRRNPDLSSLMTPDRAAGISATRNTGSFSVEETNE